MAFYTTRKLTIPHPRADLDRSPKAFSAIAPDGQKALRVVNGFPTTILDLRTGAETVIPGDARYVSWVHVAAGGWGVVVDERSVQVVDLTRGVAKRLKLPGYTAAVVVQPGVLAARTERNAVELLDAATGKPIGSMLQAGVGDLMVSPHGVLVTTKGHVATLWTGRQKWLSIDARNADEGLWQPRFSPDGSRVGFVEGSHLRIVDVATAHDVRDVPLPADADVLDWILLGNDEALMVLRDGAKAQIATIDLRADQSKLVQRAVAEDHRLRTALSAHGVLLDRGTLLVPTAPPAAPAPAPAVVWVGKATNTDGAKPAKPAKPAGKQGSKPAKAKPVLHLGAAALRDLETHYAEALALLASHVEPRAFAAKAVTPERKAAESAAKALKAVVLSSDIDADFAACVLEGEITGAQVKTLKPPKNMPAWLFLPDLGSDELRSIDDYLSSTDQEAHQRAAKLLEASGPLRQVRIEDEASGYSVVLTLATTAKAMAPGLITVRSDT